MTNSAADSADKALPDTASKRAQTTILHPATIRITHWINAVCFGFMLWSGIAILYAYPQFHWGQVGNLFMEPVLKLPITLNVDYNSWARQMHFAFAWLIVINACIYLCFALLSGHVPRRLLPRLSQLRWRHLKGVFAEHFRQPKSHVSGDYNVVQQLAYLAVIFVLLPLIVITGLAMSPAMVANQPWLGELFGGHQSARFLHFIAVCLVTLFVVVHLAMVLASGPVTQIWAMISGRAIHSHKKGKQHD